MTASPSLQLTSSAPGIAWEIDRKLTAEAVRPMIYYLRGGTCWRPEVKNITIMVNSIFNGWRMEDAWLDR